MESNRLPATSKFVVNEEVVSWMNESVDPESSGWLRVKTPKVFRELNKRLRSIFADGGEKYGADPKTARELEERRQAAIKIRNKELLKNEDDDFEDNYPDGDPNGLTAGEIFQEIGDADIDYYFGKITDHTKTMIKAFSDALGDPIDQFDIKNVQHIASSVISATEEDVVLKEYRRVTSAGDSAHRHELANQMQTIASFFAALFMDNCEAEIPEKIPATLEFLMLKTAALGPATDVRYMSCEPRLDTNARFIRFSNNWDYVMSEACAQAEGVSVELLRFVVAFSHYTYTVTRGELMIVDLQGTIKASATAGGLPTVLLTDPAIHSPDRTRFGSMNHSKAGMCYFFETHVCNEFCAALKLPRVTPSDVFDS
ncbi:Efk-1 [Aphelenchoides fujianensis]|nr:Efk-1 [Aphelenchoides fujianensis]